MKYKVITVTNNPSEYPEFEDASKKYPELVDVIEDEVDTFVITEDDDRFWYASEFFMMTEVKDFQTNWPARRVRRSDVDGREPADSKRGPQPPISAVANAKPSPTATGATSCSPSKQIHYGTRKN